MVLGGGGEVLREGKDSGKWGGSRPSPPRAKPCDSAVGPPFSQSVEWHIGNATLFRAGDGGCARGLKLLAVVSERPERRESVGAERFEEFRNPASGHDGDGADEQLTQ